MAETEFAMATRHVREQRFRIKKQRALIAHLKAKKLPTDQATDFLEQMRQILKAMQAHVDRISN